MIHRFAFFAVAILMATSCAHAATLNLRLTAPDAGKLDNFGSSAALSGTTALIGSPRDDDNGYDSGSAYLFDSTTGAFIRKFTAPDGARQDEFGTSVALAETSALIQTKSGSAYLFDLITGDFISKLTAPERDAFVPAGESAFTGQLSPDNNTRIPSVDIFDSTTGDFVSKLTPPDGKNAEGFGAGRLGNTIAVSDATTIVGSPRWDNRAGNIGSAYVFDSITGEFFALLLAPAAGRNDLFGRSVAVFGTSALIGSPGDSARSGSAYLFRNITEPMPIPELDLVPLPAGAWFLISGVVALLGCQRRMRLQHNTVA